MTLSGWCSYGAVQRGRRPQQKAQSLVDGTSYNEPSPGEVAGDRESDLPAGHPEL